MMVLLNSHTVFYFLINCKNNTHSPTNLLSKPIIHKWFIIIFINGTTIFDAIYPNIYFLNTQSLLKTFLMFFTITLPLMICKQAKFFYLYSLSMIWNISINIYICNYKINVKIYLSMYRLIFKRKKYTYFIV